MDDPLQALITEKALAESLGVSVATVRGLRGRGLPYLKVGIAVMFDVAEAVAWIRANCRRVSAQGGAQKGPPTPLER